MTLDFCIFSCSYIQQNNNGNPGGNGGVPVPLMSGAGNIPQSGVSSGPPPPDYHQSLHHPSMPIGTL